jgi:hypothetical protein
VSYYFPYLIRSRDEHSNTAITCQEARSRHAHPARMRVPDPAGGDGPSNNPRVDQKYRLCRKRLQLHLLGGHADAQEAPHLTLGEQACIVASVEMDDQQVSYDFPCESVGISLFKERRGVCA